MRSHYLFLLVYLLGNCCGVCSSKSNATCVTGEKCSQVPDATSHFLQCFGLPAKDTGRGHMRKLKEVLEAAMDVYTFMRTSMTGVPFLSIQGSLALNPRADPLQNEALVQMWMEVKIKPLLKSVTKHFLVCLSTKNFSCSTYQTVVKELSHHYSEMNPVRQKWIYTFFMYPFLSGDRVAGCVSRQESSEEWLMKNFGAFRAMARLKDFSALNMVFSGLEVLHLLSPAQKAELLLRPEVTSLDNGTLSLVFHSLMTGGPGPSSTTIHGGGHHWTTPSGGHNWTTSSGGQNWTTPSDGHNWTSPGYPTYSPLSIYSPYQPQPPVNNIKQIVNGFMTVFKPIGSFVHDFVSFTQERKVSEIRSTTLTQFLLNWTLAELANMYRPQNTSTVPERPIFDVTNVEDWYKHVVMPVLRRFLPNNEALMHPNITLPFYEVFNLDHGTMDDETSEIQDICSITLDKSPCGLTDAVANVANILHCAARSNLTISEVTVERLLGELTERLTLLIKELSTANFKELASEFQQIFREADPPSLTQEHLNDPNFIKLWFQIKLLPLLPDVPTALLSCLSTKNFTCQVFQTIVAAFSKYERHSYPNSDIYKHFIYPFLLHHNTSDPQCVSSANDSAEWLIENFGVYSKVASITDFYKLNPNFSGVEILHLFTPKQIADLLLLPLPTPPDKDVVIDRVFDFLLESPEDRRLPDVLNNLHPLTVSVSAACEVYKQILERLYGAIPLLPRKMEPIVWAFIDQLIQVAPDECVPENLTCPVTLFNGTNICRGVNSSDLHSYLNTYMEVPCNFTLGTYACAQLENFTANQLVSLLKCSLPENSRQSRVLWKMLLTKLSPVLDLALDMLADTSMLGPSASAVLDVIGEIRVSMLTDEQLMNSSIINKWFSGRLRAFLPFASGRFLRCLSSRNLSCHSYQLILQEFIHHFDNISQQVVVNSFIIRFLSQPHSGPGCVSFSNGSAEWLMENLGPFSKFLNITQMLQLNPNFKPLEVLQLLTPSQSAELLVLILPTSLEKDTIINAIFDRLTEPLDEMKLLKFLTYLSIYHSQGNLSCSSYKTLFTRLDLVLPTVSLQTLSFITTTKMYLSQFIPPGCAIYSGQCNVTMANEGNICVGVNSTILQHHLNSGQMNGRFCDFAVEEFACASLSMLKAEDLAVMLACNRSSNTSSLRPILKLLLSKASHVLDAALDLLTNTTLDPRNPVVSMVLDSIREIRLDTFGLASLNNPAFIQLWFNRRLRPFLPAVSPDFLSCLATRGLNCSAYQHIVKILSRLQPHMTLARQMSVYTHFIRVFLTRNNTAVPSCSSNTNNSGEWLQRNLGSFSVFASFQDLHMLYSNFSAMEALPQLTVRQLAEVSSTPGQLTSAAQVMMVMRHIPDRFLHTFFDFFSPAIMGHENMFPPVMRSAMLQVVFDRANLSDHLVGESVVLLWLQNRLRPLLVNLSPQHVAPFFRILAGRNCRIEQQGVKDLNSTISSLSEDTKKEIHNHIIQILKGPIPLHCYGDNFNHSFYSFLERSFLGFQFPNLTTFLSLMPHDRMHQLVNSMPPSALGDFLRRPDIVDNDAELCVIYDNYIQTPMFLETEYLPAVVRRPTLPCVWPIALSSSERSEVNAWFDRRLHNYLGFLTKSLISFNSTHNASCLAFQKLISVLGDYNYTVADFMRGDVFNTIRAYLTSVTVPRCYNPSDPELNSTAWFVEYIGPFIPFLTLEDLQMFGSEQIIQMFTVNPENIALLSNTILPLNLTDYYTELVYQQDSNFYPLLLPPLYQCFASGPAFSQLTTQESVMVLHNLTIICTALDPQISAALVGNLGDGIDATAISAIGNGSTGMSTGQIKTIQPQDLYDALSTLSDVTGWDEGQAKAIIQSLMSSGLVQINSTASLFMLGSLVVGVPADTFTSISGSQLITASKNPLFLEHITSASEVVQEIFVTQIISVNSNSETIIQNVPDEMATEIPRALLLGLSNDGSVIDTLNKKKWKPQQVELFFEVMAVESATAALGSPNNLSSSVLQGFTCTGVRNVQKAQIKRLIKACRRTGRNKVTLVETQLTCMYNHIKEESDATSFNLYPHDMLLYYDYSMVPQSSCRLYFEQLAEADFSVFSSVLSFKRTALFDNARSCLDITSTSLTEDNISVLGNMCCTLDGSYIQNSDPSILDELKECTDLDGAQAAAVEALLQSGTTQFGAPSTWNEQTLKDLGMLPLYLTSTFYSYFDKRTKREFLRYFLQITESNRLSRQKKRRLIEEIRKSLQKRSKRSIANECTIGNITQVTISDEAFPFDYDDINQFNCCLSAATVKDNLEAITEKVVQEEYLKIVLSKLQEAYGANSAIPEDQVQLLGPASRVATITDINMWSITQIDTLFALMDSLNGPWDPSLAKAVISKYLSNAGNKLGSSELNAIGGANLCSLDLNILENISPASLKEADALTVSSCITEKKKALFTIARQAFSTNTRSTVSPSSYQLTLPFIGGADIKYVRNLAVSNLNMDMATFISLDENVLLNLTVSEVKGLLGTNVADLKPYENQRLVNDWISRQSQTDLNTLGVGLVGGTNTTSTTTAAPTSSNPTATTVAPTSSNPAATTAAPTSSNPAATTAAPTSSNPAATTVAPTSSNPAATTAAPTSSNPAATTAAPTSSNPAATTVAPTSSNPAATTAAPTSSNPAATTAAPTSSNPAATTVAPTSSNPAATTAAPTSSNPAATTAAPTSSNPAATTAAPTSSSPTATTATPTTFNPTTTATPTSSNPTTTTTSSATTSSSVTSTTGNSGACIRAEAGFIFLVLLLLLTISLV